MDASKEKETYLWLMNIDGQTIVVPRAPFECEINARRKTQEGTRENKAVSFSHRSEDPDSDWNIYE